MYSLFLSLRNHAPWNSKELILLILLSCVGWASNHFTGLRFPGQSDISAAVGALAVGFLANLYGRFFNGNAFVIMVRPSLSFFGIRATRSLTSDARRCAHLDHGDPLPAAIGPRERRAVHVRVAAGGGVELVDVVPVRVPDRAAARVGLDRAHGRAGDIDCARAPDPVEEAGGGRV